MQALYPPIQNKAFSNRHSSFSTMEGSFKNPKLSTTQQPEDKHKIAYVLHFFLGAGNLLPWNALITAVDYFGYLYPGRHVEKVFSVTYMATSLLVLLLLLGFRCCRTTSSYRLRMNLGFSMFVLSLMATPVMQWFWHTDAPKMEIMSSSKAYLVVVASVFVCGLADGLIAGTLIGTAGMLPEKYMQAVFAGTASSGVLISILRITTKASLPQTPEGLKTSAQFYFIISSAILIGCIISCNLLHKLPVMQHHYKKFEYTLPSDTSSYNTTLWTAFAGIWFPAVGIFLLYAVTLSIFPGFLAENVRSELLKDWYPIVLIAAFNLSDFAGKSLTGVYVVKSVRKVAWGCVARVVFYPLLVWCLRWPATEAPVVALTVMLGLSNGYLTSAVMILAPKEVPQAQAEVAAIVMVLLLGMGLVAGSVISWLWLI